MKFTTKKLRYQSLRNTICKFSWGIVNFHAVIQNFGSGLLAVIEDLTAVVVCAVTTDAVVVEAVTTDAVVIEAVTTDAVVVGVGAKFQPLMAES